MIRCDCHDHFEIACMHHSQVRILLSNGLIKQGIAQDIVTEQRREFLLVKQGKERHKLELTEIVQLVSDQHTVDIR